MGETRVQAATLLCKIFLHYLVLLSEWDGMLDLWLKILDLMDRLMNSGQGDNLVGLYIRWTILAGRLPSAQLINRRRKLCLKV